MFSGNTIFSKTLVIDTDPGGNNELFWLLKAPRPLTIEAFHMVSEQTQNAGTAVVASIQKWSAAGAVAGTVGALGGTAVASILTARTPSSGSVDRARNFIDEGEWIAIMYQEEGAGWISGDRIAVQVDFVFGKGNTTDS